MNQMMKPIKSGTKTWVFLQKEFLDWVIKLTFGRWAILVRVARVQKFFMIMVQSVLQEFLKDIKKLMMREDTLRFGITFSCSLKSTWKMEKSNASHFLSLQ